MIRINKTNIKDFLEIIYSPVKDNRGSFLNIFRNEETVSNAIWGERKINQINISFNRKKGSIRGIHLQKKPYEEAKLISCIEGKVWDLCVDLRKSSSTYGKWHGIELSPEKHNACLIPEGCAHGFQTLVNNTRLLYIHSGYWAKQHETGIKWDDPNLKINWPIKITEISQKDKELPYF